MTIVLQAAPLTYGLTFLQLCQRTRELANMNGNGPSTTVGQTGDMGLLVGWVRQAWIDIQNRHRFWRFLRKSFSFNTVVGQASYSLLQMGAADLRALDTDSLRIYLTGSGVSDEQFLVEWDWPSYRDTYAYGAQTNSRPMVFAVNPANKALHLGAIPDTTYTVRGDYYSRGQVLTADGDVPNIPDEFHMVIVYRALMKYAGFDAAPEVKQEAIENYKTLMTALEGDQLEEITVGEPLA